MKRSGIDWKCWQCWNIRETAETDAGEVIDCEPRVLRVVARKYACEGGLHGPAYTHSCMPGARIMLTHLSPTNSKNTDLFLNANINTRKGRQRPNRISSILQVHNSTERSSFHNHWRRLNFSGAAGGVPTTSRLSGPLARVREEAAPLMGTKFTFLKRFKVLENESIFQAFQPFSCQKMELFQKIILKISLFSDFIL